MQGARDFLKALAIKVVVESKATNFHIEGFDKCQAQLEKLGGFAEGFDRSRLDASLTADLEPYAEEDDAPSVDDEFAVLTEEIEKID
ncbi:UNVERIFIED_CONTAM: hypothetical protein Sradi_1860700 [Sesamum radiatum]|uniref:Uncharacterized protein n=1 Tax=Sesamum radiatum TaxID=300843 RepID=A0AAW2TYB4_SESRA